AQTRLWLSQCMSVRCTGSELSLAECTLYAPQSVENVEVVAVKCYTEPTNGSRQNECPEFTCVNRKCIAWKHTCDGTDHCGDNSDEMCCKSCTNGFHCKSGVCIPSHAVQDGVRDCLGGEDEVHTDEKNNTGTDAGRYPVYSNPLGDIQYTRNYKENQLECGIPNMEYVYRTEEENGHRRRKRVVGGEETLPTQIQWQVAIQEADRITCGGVYLGGCWVLTAARCVKPKPQNFKVKFSLWKKHFRQQTSDIARVKNIIIHEDYNSRTHQNDIALVQLEEVSLENKCLHPNPAVRAVCLPWSPLQFQPGDNCTISGWGKNREGRSTNILNWANVTIIAGCGQYHSGRISEGMQCAGDLSGSVDFCQGDTGGPLVCEDASGLSFVWGIMSWGEKCGEANYPGVYTKVSHYFEWIRFHTGWSAVTKFNH
uniref:Peptidase S1 domain-containing protein n=1 Tax=Astyanax mexicanus TaxID=7994 RepID=A0A8B9JDT7_ASTMX